MNNSHLDSSLALNVVYQGIESINSFRSPHDAISLHPDVPLAGEEGCLDSLELITLMLNIERQIGELVGDQVSLVDSVESESDLAAFHTPSTLANFVVERCQK